MYRCEDPRGLLTDPFTSWAAVKGSSTPVVNFPCRWQGCSAITREVAVFLSTQAFDERAGACMHLAASWAVLRRTYNVVAVTV